MATTQRRGKKLSIAGEKGLDDNQTITLKYIDWGTALNNHYLLVSQLWIYHDIYKRRPDLIGYVNGIPLRSFH